eukprot:5357663-Prymnesium_polylepis.3
MRHTHIPLRSWQWFLPAAGASSHNGTHYCTQSSTKRRQSPKAPAARRSTSRPGRIGQAWARWRKEGEGHTPTELTNKVRENIYGRDPHARTALPEDPYARMACSRKQGIASGGGALGGCRGMARSFIAFSAFSGPFGGAALAALVAAASAADRRDTKARPRPLWLADRRETVGGVGPCLARRLCGGDADGVRKGEQREEAGEAGELRPGHRLGGRRPLLRRLVLDALFTDRRDDEEGLPSSNESGKEGGREPACQSAATACRHESGGVRTPGGGLTPHVRAVRAMSPSTVLAVSIGCDATLAITPAPIAPSTDDGKYDSSQPGRCISLAVKTGVSAR